MNLEAQPTALSNAGRPLRKRTATLNAKKVRAIHKASPISPMIIVSTQFVTAAH